MILFRTPQSWYALLSLFSCFLLLISFAGSMEEARKFWAANTRRMTECKKRIFRYRMTLLFTMIVILLFTSLALMRPSGNPRIKENERRGRDVVILLDVSRSMDAQDLYPSRLERAKIEITETLGQMQGDRVALMVFAGNSVLKCPLTTDHGFLKLALDEISTHSLSLGGTRMGDALRNLLKYLSSEEVKKSSDIILITDGEDHESFPVEAARALGEAGIRLLIIGLGTEKGELIPAEDGGYMEYQGQPVYSRLDSDTLRAMAAETPGGKYLHVGTSSFDLATIYKDLVSSADKGEVHKEEHYQYDEFFPFFLIPVLLAFSALTLYRYRRDI